MILIYSHSTSKRLIYTLNVLFKYILKVEYKIVPLDVFLQEKIKPKLNYSSEIIPNCLSIIPHSLLFEKQISKKDIYIDWIQEIPYFFKTTTHATFNYDILASTFFMVSRYEEYLPTKLDEHNRFLAKNTVAFKNNFLEIPVVNIWALCLKTELEKQSVKYKFTELKYNFLNTIDIDIAYAFNGKGLFRLIGSTFKAISILDVKDLKSRINYFIKNQKDPFDTFFILDTVQQQYKTKNIYFFLLGDHGKFDKNLSYKSSILQKLIEKIVEKNEIGIHPSYSSNYYKNKTQIEVDRLQKIANKKIINSRQHYLKLEFPYTYEQLISCNIKHDFSMGFASQIGFRAGICSTYPFFNILKNEERKLLITPFQIMDGSLNQYLKLTPIKAVDKIKNIVDITKKYNGTFVSIWHNSSLCDRNEWREWLIVYEKLIQIAREN